MPLLQRGVVAAFAGSASLVLVACASSVTVNCGACPGDGLVTAGLVGAGEQVTAIRVCVEGQCRTEPYQPGYLLLVHLPTGRLHQLEVTTLDGAEVVRTARATELDVPAPRSGGGPCTCHARNLTYDPTHDRFHVTRT